MAVGLRVATRNAAEHAASRCLELASELAGASERLVRRPVNGEASPPSGRGGGGPGDDLWSHRLSVGGSFLFGARNSTDGLARKASRAVNPKLPGSKRFASEKQEPKGARDR